MTPVMMQHIAVDDEGVARVIGTRWQVTLLVEAWRAHQSSPEQFVEDYPTLTLAQLYEALAYYQDHRDDIDRQTAEDHAFVERFFAEQPEHPFVTRMRAEGRIP